MNEGSTSWHLKARTQGDGAAGAGTRPVSGAQSTTRAGSQESARHVRMGSDTPHFYSHSFSIVVPEATALRKWDLPPPREPHV